MYEQTSFTKALVAAGFKLERGVMQWGAQFYSKQRGSFTVMVSSYPGHYTCALLKASKEGGKVMDHFQTSDPQEMVTKLPSWGF